MHHRVPGLRRSPPRAGLAPTLGLANTIPSKLAASRRPSSQMPRAGHAQLQSRTGHGLLAASKPASAALTSFGVRGTGRSTSKAADEGTVLGVGTARRSSKPWKDRASWLLPYPPGLDQDSLQSVARRKGATPGRWSAAAAAEYGSRLWPLRASVRSTASLCSCGVSCAEREARPSGGQVSAVQPSVRSGARPNRSLNPRLAAAGGVSRACASRTIVAVPAYTACLRSRG